MEILSLVSVREDVIKMAPLISKLREQPSVDLELIFTGNEYEATVSHDLYKGLEIEKPDHYLDVGAHPYSNSIGETIVELEELLADKDPDLILVVGDTNCTYASAVVASRNRIKLVHIDAGIRSGNSLRTEEQNRIFTDRFSDILFTSSEEELSNLKNEDIDRDKIFFVGNSLIDSIEKFIEKSKESTVCKDLELIGGNYVLFALNKETNIDIKSNLKDILEGIGRLQREVKVVFPIHPRTYNRISGFGFKKDLKDLPNLILIDPLSYIEHLKLVSNSGLVITDVRELQDESTYLEIPCLTVHDLADREITTKIGSNEVIGRDAEDIKEKAMEILAEEEHENEIPEYWDGQAFQRISDRIFEM